MSRARTESERKEFWCFVIGWALVIIYIVIYYLRSWSLNA